MRVLACVSTKGGSGKSTLAACIAAVAAGNDRNVAVIDTDPQRSLDAWALRRKARGLDDIARFTSEPADIETLVVRLRKSGFVDLAIIDTAGIAGPGAILAARVADLVLVPVKPTSTDLSALRGTIQPLQRIGARFACVVSQVPGSAIDRARKAARALLDVGGGGSVAGAFTGARVAYDDAMAAGMGPTEHEARGQAADEVRALWAWIEAKMEEPGGKK